jgi:hypothetical protein
MNSPSESLGPLLVLLVLSGLRIAPARAQRFFPILPPDPKERLQVGTFRSKWDFPSQKYPDFVVRKRSNYSLLITADYFVTRRLSVGGWWHDLAGTYNVSGHPDYKPNEVIADFSGKLRDLHVTHYLSDARGSVWSVQAGYNTVQIEQRLRGGGRKDTMTLRGPNFWIYRSEQVGGRSLKQHRHLIHVFVGVGYFPSADFRYASSAMLGGSVDLSPRYSVSGSVWLFDLNDAAVRTTVGLVRKL